MGYWGNLIPLLSMDKDKYIRCVKDTKVTLDAEVLQKLKDFVKSVRECRNGSRDKTDRQQQGTLFSDVNGFEPFD
jgi:ClpP class serine protease